ncbi:hypothetical protein [Pectobacterium phage Wc4-1]|uniref:Polynucleotide kinase PNKP phosphatase domain-containing protein n=1 Tax=Pectobacterium phage Wc4 TaxID=2652428 RepID=A0A5P8D706_9CAUD|nr:hypothetical protein [Pectobacterium phage Wc4]QFP93945.1 hypothetical protein [Pectobacterium phage Wc4-1]
MLTPPEALNDNKEPVPVLFKERGSLSNKLQVGRMTMKELYSDKEQVFVTAYGREVVCLRRDFAIAAVDLPLPTDVCIVCDIDGVLNYIGTRTSTDQRERLILKSGHSIQWTQIEKIVDAKPDVLMFRMLEMWAAEGKTIIFLTARGESQRIVTERFLKQNLECDFILFMRGYSANDMTAYDLKAQMIQSCIMPYYKVERFIDDDTRNINAVRAVTSGVEFLHVIR